MSKPIKDIGIVELHKIMADARLPVFRAEQIFTWIYVRDARSYSEMSNIPKVIREQFDQAYPLFTPEIAAREVSVDGSRKYLLEYHDGTRVEAVGLPSADGRLSVCCSSQAGCAMACAFCATGKAGLTRSLSCGEIADQVLTVQRDFGKRVTNVVIMGQGEPFSNYEAVIDALHILNHPKLFNIGARHMTVSTCGIVSGIDRFAEEPEQYTLAVSLHAARQEVRDELMPAMKEQKLGALRQAIVRYTEMTGRRVSFEYALMEGVNDSEEDFNALVSYCRRLLCHVNLIPLNEIDGSAFRPVSSLRLHEWRDRLEQAGIPASVRRSRGADIAGACGQLAGKSLAAGKVEDVF